MNDKQDGFAPKEGSVWRHRNGAKYAVLMIANSESQNPEYPLTVVYRNVTNGKVWSRPASEWLRSMSLDEETIIADWPACNPGCDYETPMGWHEDCRNESCSCEPAKASIAKQLAAIAKATGGEV